MKNIIVILFGVTINILANFYLHATKTEIKSIVPNIYLFFVAPMLLIIIIIVSTTYDLLKRKNILTHPGYFYDLEGNHLVFSFVSSPSILRKALPKITSN